MTLLKAALITAVLILLGTWPNGLVVLGLLIVFVWALKPEEGE